MGVWINSATGVTAYGRFQPDVWPLADNNLRTTLHRLTEQTLFTELGQIVGTPEYMSPEQAEMKAQDIDTR